MTFSPVDVIVAWVLDAALGDPAWLPWPHPVVVIGRVVSRLEARWRRPGDSPGRLLALGAALWLVVVGGTAAAAALALGVAGWLHPWLGRALGIYVAYACLATRCLDAEGRAVSRLVEKGRLVDARARLTRIVGRDTDTLPAPEVLRGALETVAENSSDGVVAPLFFLGLGAALGWGPVLGLAYKAVNTLDSMVGYRNERYEHFGRVSARLDDLANWVPARLTALLVAGAAALAGENGRGALRVAWRDGRLHKSPNSGYPEAAFAGALGVRLGGTNTYRGVPRPSPHIGDPGPALTPGHLTRALRLLWGVSVGAAVLAGVAAAAS
ncbi:MAG: cobalamin biosynthesis protein CobD [Deltaproteobacteria bacterium]|nr:cobalamin biosynthesis protein CobD [Deltaproteobacteria bacterium]